MRTLQNVRNLFLVALVVLAAYSCNKDDDSSKFTPRTETYQLAEVAGTGVSGTATLIENEDGSTTVEIELTGTAAANSHPAHIHSGSVDMPGVVVVTLNNVDGDTGMSSTQVSQFDVGLSNITYDDLLEYFGYINIHMSAGDDTIIAQGNIGSAAQ